MSAFSVGLLGCGPWGRLILRDLIALGADVHVWSISEDSRAAARSGGAQSVHDSISGLPDCAGFVIATATVHHAATIEAVAHRKAPIFVEKPLCADADEAGRLVALCGERLFVMDKWRYHNGVLHLAELARSGVLGQIVGMHTTRIGYADNHHDVDAAWILAPHDLSIALEVFGRLGSLRSAHGHVEDDGSVRSLAATFSDDDLPWLSIHVSDRSPIERREVHVVGTDGSALLGGGYANRLEVRRGTVLEQHPFEVNMPLADELGAFLEHLRGGPPPRSSAADGAAIVRLIAAARSAVGAEG